MLILDHISYYHPNKELLFGNLNLAINKHDKIAIIGNNGVGKSTLLKIMAGVVQPESGSVKTDSISYYIPQIFGQFNDLSIAEALGIEDKLNALKDILDGNVTETKLVLLDDDWTIEDRCHEALKYWGVEGLNLADRMNTLSGGQKTKIFLSGVLIHQPDIVLMDEPSNHLDVSARLLLYDFIKTWTGTLVVVSHDRTLLNLLNEICELDKHGITTYGGNYDFYLEQKGIETNALNNDIKSKENSLRKAREVERDAMDRKQKLDARGKSKQEKAGLPTISMNTFRNNAEKSASRLKGAHTEKTNAIAQELNELRNELPDIDKMKFGFDNSTLHKGKTLITLHDIWFGYGSETLWNEPLNLQISSSDRLALKGPNGSGKTTLIKIILGELKPVKGRIYVSEHKPVYIDQDYSLINNHLNVYAQAEQFNHSGLKEHDIKIRLSRFLFTKDDWDKPCEALSGGEKMRLMLCCLTISNQAPDMIILDEPTNNLDILNLNILTAAINEYKGALVVVSHDRYFLEQIGIERMIDLG